MTENNERDTKFLGFAKLQMPELDSLFASLYQAYATGNLAKRDEYSQRIETYLAQGAYDLVVHVLLEADLDNDYYGRFDYDTKAIVNSMPDMTEWPPTP